MSTYEVEKVKVSFIGFLEAVKALFKKICVNKDAKKNSKEEDMVKNIAIGVLVLLCIILGCMASCNKKVVVPSPATTAVPTEGMVGLGEGLGVETFAKTSDVKSPEVAKNVSEEKVIYIFSDDPCYVAKLYGYDGKPLGEVKIGVGQRCHYDGHAKATLHLKVFKNGVLVGKYTEVFKGGAWIWKINPTPQKTQDMSQLPS